MTKWNGKRFSIYTSDEENVLGLLDELGTITNDVQDTLNNKTDLYGDHKGSWCGIERPTMVAEGMASILDDLSNKEIPTIKKNLDDNVRDINNKITTIANNQIPTEYLNNQIDNYVSSSPVVVAKSSIVNLVNSAIDEMNILTEYKFNISSSIYANTITRDWKLIDTGCTNEVGYGLYKIYAPCDIIVKVLNGERYHLQTTSYVFANSNESDNILEKGVCCGADYFKVKKDTWLIVSGKNCKAYEVNTKQKFLNVNSTQIDNFIFGAIKDEDGTVYKRDDVAQRYFSDFIELNSFLELKNNQPYRIILYNYDKNGKYIDYTRVESGATFYGVANSSNIFRVLLMGENTGSVDIIRTKEKEHIDNFDTKIELRQNIYDITVNDDNRLTLEKKLNVHNRKAYDLKVMSINPQLWGSHYSIYKNILKNHNCDIIGVQEHNSAFSDKSSVVNFLKELNYCSHHELLPNSTYPVGKLLSSKCDLKRYSHNEFNTQLGEIRGYQKGYIKVNGKEICVINAHLATSGAESAKIAQSMELVEICKKEKYFILIADFNFVTTESQNEYELIAKPFINQGFNLGNWKDKNYIMTWSDSSDRSGVWHPTDNIITSSNIDIITSFVDETKLNDDIIEPIDHLPFISYLKVN